MGNLLDGGEGYIQDVTLFISYKKYVLFKIAFANPNKIVY